MTRAAAQTASAQRPLAPLELALGLPLGPALEPDPIHPLSRGPQTPAAALRAVLGDQLRAGPVSVAFSGGRDSSLLLAAATVTAREQGLADPVPVIYRSRRAPDADEREWQDLVLDHLGLTAPVVIDGDDELDLIGPLAMEGVRRHGVRFPVNAHFVGLIARAAAGRTLLLGIGGDELFASWRWRYRADVLARRLPLAPDQATTVLLGGLPGRLRRTVIRRRERPHDVPWLTQAGREAVRTVISHQESQPVRFDRYVTEIGGRRAMEVMRRTLHSFAADAGARLCLPLLDPRFLAALAAAGGRRGLGNRTRAMGALGAGLLPTSVLERGTKAAFEQVYWGERSRAFARDWEPEPLVGELVDPVALRAEWLAARPHARSATLLQLAASRKLANRTPI